MIGKAKKNVKSFFRAVERNIAREDRYLQLGGWCLLPCWCDLVFKGARTRGLLNTGREKERQKLASECPPGGLASICLACQQAGHHDLPKSQHRLFSRLVGHISCFGMMPMTQRLLLGQLTWRWASAPPHLDSSRLWLKLCFQLIRVNTVPSQLEASPSFPHQHR